MPSPRRGDTCPGCARSRFLREPRADDPVLLCTVRHALAVMIEPLLEEEKVPYSKLALGSSALLGGSTFLEKLRLLRALRGLRGPRWNF